MKWIDSHSHLSDPRLASQIGALTRRASELGIDGYLQGGIGPEDWLSQMELHKKLPGLIPCFGIHPYWVASHNEQECEQALDVLARSLHQSVGIGETGLDLRPQYLHFEDGPSTIERQIDIFEKQIELAKLANKPLVLHLVRCFREALRIFEFHQPPRCGGMVHSFNGSAAQAEAYLSLGFHLSVGGPVARAENEKLHQAVSIIPLDRLLVETDSPDQAPPSRQGTLNDPSTLLEVAAKVAAIKGLSTEEILDSSSRNLRKLFSL